MNFNIAFLLACASALNTVFSLGIPDEGFDALGNIDVQYVFDSASVLVGWIRSLSA